VPEALPTVCAHTAHSLVVAYASSKLTRAAQRMRWHQALAPRQGLRAAAHPTSRARQEVVAVARAGLCARRRAVLLAVFRTEAILVCSCCGIPRCTFRFP
jgi:hypothetical protein